MNKTIVVTAALLCFGLAAAPAAAEKKSEQAASRIPSPDPGKLPFRLTPVANYVFVQYTGPGPKNWTAQLDLYVKCAPVAPATSCGSNFPGGTFHKGWGPGAFPQGSNNGSLAAAPSGNSAIVPGGTGLEAVFLGMPVGSYKITAMLGSNPLNAAPETSVTVTTPPPGSPTPVHLNPAATFGVNPRN